MIAIWWRNPELEKKKGGKKNKKAPSPSSGEMGEANALAGFFDRFFSRYWMI